MAVSVAAAKASKYFKTAKKTAEKAGFSLNAGTALFWGSNAYFTASGYAQARREGYGQATSLVKGLTDAVLIDIIGWKAYLPLMAVNALPSAATSGLETLGRHARNIASERYSVPFQGNTFVDTKQTYTMRQTGMQLAQRSRYNLQHAMLGNEAQHLHR